jgi:hypothetical protein
MIIIEASDPVYEGKLDLKLLKEKLDLKRNGQYLSYYDSRNSFEISIIDGNFPLTEEDVNKFIRGINKLGLRCIGKKEVLEKMKDRPEDIFRVLTFNVQRGILEVWQHTAESLDLLLTNVEWSLLLNMNFKYII